MRSQCIQSAHANECYFNFIFYKIKFLIFKIKDKTDKCRCGGTHKKHSKWLVFIHPVLNGLSVLVNTFKRGLSNKSMHQYSVEFFQ